MEKSIIANIESHYPQLTAAGKTIANYLITNLTQLPFETADSIAKATGTSGITVGRLLRTLGYKNLEDLKLQLREQTPQTWLITDRLGAFHSQHTQEDHQHRSLELELAAVSHAYALSTSPVFAQVADRIASADAVFVYGIQSTRGIANAFFSHLEYLRPQVFYADGQSGSYIESMNSGFKQPYLILTDLRAYSRLSRQLCAAALERNIQTCLVTDVYCTWARDYPLDLLQVKTDVGQFWDSYSALTCLFNLLNSAVVERLGTTLSDRLAANKQLQKTFGQFEF